ncbi:MAG: hypothetical protein DMG23_09395 [Acidobacteria bacterium]|nr:MAG: hypothetical protein DMG23_09395 [Acidobacteriota bacterium]
MYFATVAWDTSIPSLSSSPWIRGAHQSGFAKLIFRTSSRTSKSIAGSAVRRALAVAVLRNDDRFIQKGAVVFPKVSTDVFDPPLVPGFVILHSAKSIFPATSFSGVFCSEFEG